MTTTLTPGANTAVPASTNLLVLQHGSIPGAEIDVSGFLVTASGKVRGDHDMAFYGQPSVAGGAVTFGGTANGETRFSLDLNRIPVEIEKVVFTATIHENRANFGAVREIAIILGGSGGQVLGQIPCQGRTETALILADLYRRNGQWKIRIVGQGFNGGLAALATHLGVEIAAPAPSAPTAAPAAERPAPTPPAPPPAPAAAPAAPRINLSKVSLTKETRTVSLKKDGGRFGKIRVNLNWNQKPSGGGIMKMFGPKPVDLDLGCFIEDRYGKRICVQALGNAFGDYGYFPYAKLLGDDRTGAVSDGEWLEINGEMWAEFNRVLIFAYIYDGAPNWRQTDGTIRILIPDQPEVEIRMNEYGASEGMCAVAMLENEGGRIKVSREMRFFRGHQIMDAHYGWGMRWVAGSK
ncbi:TerD family protein [Defluviimonas salinarum]|uniref:TerD domain-containing protein n=1 Tax=Defluviimonas salinarum TaxID=2992147 RepID=A0ABT3J4C0_9RHOB|nr:TerD domain-containing protein [Defluviimonas salinarum]MCW3782537.1 TerD domain-containing protein [Defluviimonas salinarum]